MRIVEENGKVKIAGTRIRVKDIVEKYVVMNESPEVIAKEFRISVSDVHEALSYYYGHAKEIREEIRRDKEFIEKFRKEMIRHEIPSR